MKKILFIIVAICMTLSFTACEYDTVVSEVSVWEPNTDASDDTDDPDPGTATSFTTEIYPYFAAQKCTSCHGTSGGVDLSTVDKAYTGLTRDSKRLVPANASSESPLVTKLKGLKHGNNSLKTSDFTKIEKWVDEGAKKN